MEILFGPYIRDLRKQAGFGQREFARLIGVAPSYLNDMELGRRASPRLEVLHSIRCALNVDEEFFYDLAGASKNRLPPDVEEYLLSNESSTSLVRLLKNLHMSEAKVMGIKNLIASQNYKAIIIAAGLGSRLNELTEDCPKCMLELDGKSILEHQLDAYNTNGISDISVIRGYKKEKINIAGLNFFENTDFKNNNILNSLFYGEEALEGNVIVSYSDIVFSPKIVERLLDSNADISIVVDVDWRGRYKNRKEHPISEAENVIVDANNAVVDIGKIMTSPDDVYGEFIGMMKFSPRGCEIFKRHFHRAKALFWNKPYQRAATFQQAYITDILKDMAELGVPVQTIIIEQGWQEIDTAEDYNNARLNFSATDPRK
jgi:choline kinase/transcriptional regulator with XRE-family HTH domain